MVGDRLPVHGHIRVGAHHEPVWKGAKNGAPVAGDLAIVGDVTADRQLRPKLWVALHHFPDLLRLLEPGMRPEYPRARVLAKESCYRVGIRVGKQQETILPGQLYETAHHRQVRVGAVHVKLANGDILVFTQPPFEIGDDRLVVNPGVLLDHRAVRPQRGQHQIGRLGVEPLRPLVAGTRYQSPDHPGFAQLRYRRLRGEGAPGVAVVVDVCVHKRQFSGACERRNDEKERKTKESEHGLF